jgi:neutral trehalase
MRTWIERGREGLDECWDPELGLCIDLDLRSGEPARVRTVAGLAPLISGGLTAERLSDLLKTLDSPQFAGNPNLRWPVPPSTSPKEPGFLRRSYWRGPTWPVVNWLLWWSLNRLGQRERASKLRRAALDQLANGGFAEYFEPFTGEPLGSTEQSWNFEPFTGEPLGSTEQSWTAAVALDMLAAGDV